MKLTSAVPVVVLAAMSWAGSAHGSTLVEGFEGVVPGPNSPTPSWAPGTDYLAVGAMGPYRFSSGTTLVSPVPNTEAVTQTSGLLLVDFSVNNGNGSFGLEFNGAVTSPSDLPGGTAFLGWDNTAANGSIRFSFSEAQKMVGAFVDAADGNIVETAYNASGKAIAATSIGSGDVSIWPSNFESIKKPGIMAVSFNGDFAVIDNLTFTATPEPASFWLIGFALALIGVNLLARSPGRFRR